MATTQQIYAVPQAQTLYPNQSIRPLQAQPVVTSSQQIHASVRPIQVQQGQPGQPIQVQASQPIQVQPGQPQVVRGEVMSVRPQTVTVSTTSVQPMSSNAVSMEVDKLRKENAELKKRIEELEKYSVPRDYDFEEFYEKPKVKHVQAAKAIEDNIKPAIKKREYDRSTFTIEQMDNNFTEKAIELYFAKDNIQPEKVEIVFDNAKVDNIMKFNLSDVLEKFPRAGIFLYFEKTVLMLKGSKKASEANEDNELVDNEFKIHLLMYNGEYRENCYLKPTESRSFVLGNPNQIMEIPYLLTINNKGSIAFEDDFLKDIVNPEYFENVGGIENFFPKQAAKIQRHVKRLVAFNWE